MSVRELIQMLILNCNLDDTIDIEYSEPSGTIPSGDPCVVYKHLQPRRVLHLGGGEALIECHDD